MVFHLSLRTSCDDHPQMYACFQQANGRAFRSKMSQFKYFRFLRSVFSDFSKDIRVGKIDFCHPGDGKVCVTWHLSDSFDPTHFNNVVEAGVCNVNQGAQDQYKAFFEQGIEMQLLSTKPFEAEFSIHILQEIQKQSISA